MRLHGIGPRNARRGRTPAQRRLQLGGRSLGLVLAGLAVVGLAVHGVPPGIQAAAGRAAAVLGREDWAERALRSAVARDPDQLREKLRVVDALTDLANLYWRQARYADAEPLLRRARSIEQGTPLGPHSTTLEGLARVLHDQGRYAEAAALYEQSLAGREQQGGAATARFASVLDWLAELRRDEGRYAESEALHRRALETRERVFPSGDPRIAVSLFGLGTLFHERGMLGRAELYLVRALDLMDAGASRGRSAEWLAGLLPSGAEADGRRARLLTELGVVYAETGRLDEAETALLRALDLTGRRELALTRCAVLRELGRVEHRRGRRDAAERQLREALRAIPERLAHHPARAVIHNDLAALEIAERSYDEAERHLERAALILQTSLDPSHPSLTEIHSNLDRVRSARAHARAS